MIISLDNIQSEINNVNDFLERNGVDRKRRVSYRLILEEYLLIYRGENENADFSIECSNKGSNLCIKIEVTGESKNVLKDDSVIVENLLNEIDAKPTWLYRRGKNRVVLLIKPITPDFNSIKFLFKFMTSKKKTFVIASILRFVNMGLSILEPILTARIIVAYSGSQIEKILIFAALIFVLSGANSIINYAASYMLRKSYSAMVKDMQTDLTDVVLKMKTACMDENGSGLFTQRLIGETNNAVEQIDELLGAATDIFKLISLFISFAIISPIMLVYEIILFSIYIFIQTRHVRAMTDDGRRCRTADEKHSSFVSEMVRAHRDIKLLHCEESFLSRITLSIQDSVDRLTDMRVHSMRFIFGRTQFLSVSDFIYMALLAVFMVKSGMQPSTALVLFNYNGRVYGCSNSISRIMNTYYKLGLSAERIYQLMNSKDFETEVFGDTHLENIKGEIELKNVSFSYKNSRGNTVKVLEDVNLHIGAGETAAFVGRSGCGKSTILSLISRLYDPTAGNVLLDNHDVRELDRDTLRGNIGFVSQMPYIFNMSIRENLAVAKKDVTDEEIERVCKMACIYDDIMAMPNGFDSVVGEGGITLSGGQRQRIALARSLLQKHAVMILDEATSALDNITQAKIQSAIENLQGNQTVIMVAHRLSTVINCEHIFFIKDGKVYAHGKHRELLENCAAYRDLYGEE